MDALDKRNVLPTTVQPSHYDIFFETRMDSFTFSGNVSIEIKVLRNTQTICLNTNQLEIQSAWVMVDKDRISAKNIIVDSTLETTSFSFDRELKKGLRGFLVVHYSGEISSKLAGYYRSEYMEKGERRYMAVTQFEPTDARRAFPCWDEPNIKATFAISMRVEKRFTALSNMNVKDTIEDGDWKIVNFHPTPVMSTYLVAFVVGELDYIEGFATARKSTCVRIYTPRGYANQTEFAREVAIKTLDYYTEYLDIEYPLPKMDLVAVPDFGSGAMENWGLVTFRMALLLFDPAASTVYAKKQVAYVISHELAHQWFGNLVTMDWWSDLWLNEGFATHMGTKAVDESLYPEWMVWTDFFLDETKSGLKLDSLVSSHPIEVEAPNPADITQIFDAISYSKGASVIRMLHRYIGDRAFRTGLIDYLKKHRYGNARTVDLWDAFGKASGKPIRELMHGWTREVGYPVITVSERAEGKKLRLVLEQSRFLLSGSEGTGGHLWSVPINVVVYGGSAVPGWMLSKKSGVFELESDGGVYNLNGDQTGFYRVLYPAEHFRKICATIGDGTASGPEYIGVLGDAFEFGVSGHHSTVVPLELLLLFKGRTDDFFIVSEMVYQARRIQSVLYEEPSSVQDAWRRVVVGLFCGLKSSHGWNVLDGEDDQRLQLRTLVLSVLCENGHLETVREARERFSRFVGGDAEAMHPNFRSIVFSSAVRHGGVEEYEQVRQIYMETMVPDQKMMALAALTSTCDPELIERTLGQMLVDGEVRPQDSVYIARGFSANLKARRALWDHVRVNWSAYWDRFNKGSISLLKGILSSSTGGLVSAEDADEVERFARSASVEGISRAVDQSLERMRIHATWLKRDREEISEWILRCPVDQ